MISPATKIRIRDSNVLPVVKPVTFPVVCFNFELTTGKTGMIGQLATKSTNNLIPDIGGMDVS